MEVSTLTHAWRKRRGAKKYSDKDWQKKLKAEGCIVTSCYWADVIDRTYQAIEAGGGRYVIENNFNPWAFPVNERAGGDTTQIEV